MLSQKKKKERETEMAYIKREWAYPRQFMKLSTIVIKSLAKDLPGSPVVKNQPANAGDTYLSQGKWARMPKAHALQQEKPL